MEPTPKFDYTGTALPEDSDTEELFDSTIALNGPYHLAMHGIAKLVVSMLPSGDGDIVFQKSNDGGTTWVTQATVAVTGGTDRQYFDFAIEGFRDVRLRWVNGGVTQTTFDPVITGSFERGALT